MPFINSVMKKLFILISSVILFISCASSPKIETYILDSAIQQDFIRPAGLKNKTLDSEIDFTVRNEKNGITKVVVNFSIKRGKEAILPLEEASFIFDNSEIAPLSNISTLFIDRNKTEARYSSTLTSEQFKQLIRQKSPLFRVVIKSKTYDFKPSPWFIEQMRGAEKQYIY